MTPVLPARHTEKCKKFIEEYETQATRQQLSTRKYMDLLQEVANRDLKDVPVLLDDLHMHYAHDPGFLGEVQANAMRFTELFAKACTEVMPSPTEDVDDEDVLDVLMSHRGITAGAVPGSAMQVRREGGWRRGDALCDAVWCCAVWCRMV